jgi:DNA-binding transcriptional LysR family regulator
MSGDNFRDILAFLAVARERSFTRAAAQLDVSQSALSHTIRGLEARLGLRLLTRTTRSVSPTEAGERLIERVAPRFEVIAHELSAFDKLQNTPSGTVRLTTSDFALNTVLWPKLALIQPKFPDVKIEIAVNPEFTDIVAERFDAGVRFGDSLAKDMTSVRISADIRIVIVATPAYLEKSGRPKVPADLVDHACINMRFSMRGGVYAWELAKGKRNLEVNVAGAWTFNSIYAVIDAALAGFGLAYMPFELAKEHISSGRLQTVLEDWCPTFPGLHLFYPSHRQTSSALSVVVDALRYQG